MKRYQGNKIQTFRIENMPSNSSFRFYLHVNCGLGTHCLYGHVHLKTLCIFCMQEFKNVLYIYVFFFSFFSDHTFCPRPSFPPMHVACMHRCISNYHGILSFHMHNFHSMTQIGL